MQIKTKWDTFDTQNLSIRGSLRHLLHLFTLKKYLSTLKFENMRKFKIEEI